MKDKEKAEAIAIERLQHILPLTEESLDPARFIEMKRELSEQLGLSERTIRRYLARYRQHGFDGLKPQARGKCVQTHALAPDILDQAIQLRREVPSRSVSQLIQILEWEGAVKVGEIKRSTLQENLAKQGYSARQMRLYSGSKPAARRFQRKDRNDLWHADIKYGPYLPIGEKGKRKQVYLLLFLDDATRFVVHGQFYPVLDQWIVEHGLQQAVSTWGIPERVYFDNGKQFRNKWMTRCCSYLGTRLLFTRPYAPESSGKIEKLNRFVDAFLAEVKVEQPQTLDRLNELFNIWIQAYYHLKAHSSLEDGKSPLDAFMQNPKPLRFAEAGQITEAFLHEEKRRVDKAGCISFKGRLYEVGLHVIGQYVQVLYQPSDITQLEIRAAGLEPWTVQELVIGVRSAKRPEMPEHLTTVPAPASRFLRAAEQQHQQRAAAVKPAVSYRHIDQKETDHV